MMTPIQTQYNGYLFRSRIEARWAVFFDALDIKYYYEHEGFNLPNKGYYLPDFYLPEMGVFIEVKGEYPSIEERLKALELAFETGCLVCIVFGGIPSPDEVFWQNNLQSEKTNYMLTFPMVESSRCYIPNSKGIMHNWGYNDTFFISDNDGSICISNDVYWGVKNEDVSGHKYRLQLPLDAFKKARMARFETF